tara:strand:+ start:2555 stop:2821 length:267 start_codon:yes stop_codon:yes gene_type:complete
MPDPPKKMTDKPPTKEECPELKKPTPIRVDKDGKPKQESRKMERKSTQDRTLEFKTGGKVNKTGKALVHKNEVIIPADLAKKMKKLFK